MKTFGLAIVLAAILVSTLLVVVRPFTIARACTTYASGAELYNLHCVSCHGRDGQAKTRKGRSFRARNLADSGWQDRVSDERIFNVVSNGKGRMPAFGKKFSEAETDSLVQYVRSLKR